MRNTLRRPAAIVSAALLPLTALAALPSAAHPGHDPDEPHPVDAEAATNWDNYEKILLTKDTGEPIDLAVLPDSRVLHTARDGAIRLTDPSAGVTEVVNTLDVYANSEDGLQTIALDPAFEENGWVYVVYAPREMDGTAQNGAPYPATTPAGNAPNSLPEGEAESYWDRWQGYNVLSRFRWDEAAGALDLTTEQEIIRVEAQRGQCCHVAGDIAWDADGNLYLSTGDNTPAGTPGANGYAPNNDAPGMNPGFDARRGPGNTNDLRGKILRITVADDGSYTVPDGNLFPPGTAQARPEIYVMGVRNPFRIDVDRQTGALVWGDYGPDAGAPNPDRGPMGYVEWQSSTVPMNGGWPYCHGPNANYNDWDFATVTPGEWFDCDAGAVNDSRWNTGLPTVPAATAPQLYYGDDNTHQPWPELTDFGPARGQGPMGAPVYRYDATNPSPSAFPEHWDGKAFFGEFSQDYVAAFTLDLANDGPVTELVNFLPNAHLNDVAQPIWDNPMDLEFGPDGSLYVLEYGDGFFRQNPDAGLYRVDYAEGNKTPQARFTADPISGSEAPLTVTFDASASRDPEGSELTYQWDFDGDGTFDATGVTATHTYTELGRFTARLRVADPSGKFGLSSRAISVGNVAPALTLDAPNGAFFDWGDVVGITTTVDDPEDGSDPDCSRVRWAFGLGHDEHAHPVTSGTGCTFGIPTPVDAPEHGETEKIYGALVVTYTDDGHLGVPPATGEATLTLKPKLQQAEHADDSSGVEIADDDTADGLRKVVGFDAGDWLAYDPVEFGGIEGVRTRASGAGTLSLRWDAPDAAAFATVDVPAGGGWQEVETTFADLPEGTGRLYVTSNGGVDVDAFTFLGDGIADVTPPTVNATTTPAEPDGANGWFVSGDVVVTVRASDNGSIASREYSLDGGTTWSDLPAAGTVTVSAEGTSTVRYRATDTAGNVSEVGSLDVRIDLGDPTAALDGVEDGGSYGSSVTLTPVAAASDAVSGIDDARLALDGAAVASGEEVALRELAIGTHDLEVVATDVAGRVTTVTATFEITVSFADLSTILEDYAAAGVVTTAGTAQLRAHLTTAERAAAEGDTAEAIQALERFASVASNPRRVTDETAREVLAHQAESLIATF